MQISTKDIASGFSEGSVACYLEELSRNLDLAVENGTIDVNEIGPDDVFLVGKIAQCFRAMCVLIETYMPEDKSGTLQVVRVGDEILCPDYWECECDRFFVHHKSKPICGSCGAVHSDSPDARIEFVLAGVRPVLQAQKKEESHAG